MLWSEFLNGDESRLLSDWESRIERLWPHGSWSCSPSLREYRLSAYSDTPRATARPHWQCPEFYTDRLPSPRTGKIGRAFSGRCGYMLSEHERDDESGRAAERDDDPVTTDS